MYQGHIDTGKRMRAARMPHAALSGISLMSYPYVGTEVLDLIVFHDRLCIADDLEYHDISAV